MRVLATDYDYPDLSIETEILEGAGLELAVAQCRSPAEVIEAAEGASALIAQYATVTRAMLEALPSVCLVTRYGVGVDTIDLGAARARGVWIAGLGRTGRAVAALLARMRPGSYLVNTARGGLVDADALLAALDTVPLGGVALDVLSAEPPATNHPLVTHPRVLLTPHAAFYSREAEEEPRRKTALNVVSWATTGARLHPVVEGCRR